MDEHWQSVETKPAASSKLGDDRHARIRLPARSDGQQPQAAEQAEDHNKNGQRQMDSLDDTA
ncbi:MAG: hypothetical protein OHK0044_32430 [Burkholderiaceae bacterium]